MGTANLFSSYNKKNTKLCFSYQHAYNSPHGDGALQLAIVCEAHHSECKPRHRAGTRYAKRRDVLTW